jgi:predicted NBD/HSP70 family sugar kinase
MVKTGFAAKRILRPQQVRGANRAAVLHLLQEHDSLSRADVARHSGLSEGSVSRIVRTLIRDGLLREDGAENSTGGRPGRRLALDQRRMVVGVEIQNWETRCGISTMHGQIVETRRFRTPASAGETLELVAETFSALSKQLGRQRLPGIGICTRGIVNSETGTLVLGSRADWRNVPIRKFLESRFREPVLVENNVRAAALAEYTHGTTEAFRQRCFVLVQVDEGVGIAVIFEGKLYHGPNMAAGEFGQMVIQLSQDGERHDRAGSMEQLISNRALCARFAEATATKRPGNAADAAARARRIVELANSGDATAREVLQRTAEFLGAGISNLVWILDTDSIVIDGPLTGGWGFIEPLVRRQLPDNAELWGVRNIRVQPSALGGDAALIGAALLPINLTFSRTGTLARRSVRAQA